MKELIVRQYIADAFTDTVLKGILQPFACSRIGFLMK